MDRFVTGSKRKSDGTATTARKNIKAFKYNEVYLSLGFKASLVRKGDHGVLRVLSSGS